MQNYIFNDVPDLEYHSRLIAVAELGHILLQIDEDLLHDVNEYVNFMIVGLEAIEGLRIAETSLDQLALQSISYDLRLHRATWGRTKSMLQSECAAIIDDSKIWSLIVNHRVRMPENFGSKLYQVVKLIESCQKQVDIAVRGSFHRKEN